MRQLDIILRTCDNAEVHKVQRIVSAKKQDITIRCINSISKAIYYFIENKRDDYNLKLWIIDDHSSDETIKSIQYLLKGINFEIIPTNTPGNNGSLESAYAIAMANCNDLIFFIEDDYLCITSMLVDSVAAFNFFQGKLRCPVVITPVDEIVDYQGDMIFPSRLVMDEFGKRWRTTNHTTYTMLTHKYVLVKYWEYFRDFIGYGQKIDENNSINYIYQTAALFAPMPAIAVHICDIPPMKDIDWQDMWIKNEVKI